LSNRLRLLCSGLLTLGSVLPLFAQPAAAQSNAPSIIPSVIDDIVVTARRRAEPVQSVPLAMSVVGGQGLEDGGVVNTGQLSVLVPTLAYSSANPRNTAFTIRGLGSSVVAVSQANDGLESGVGFYVDGVYHARPATAAFDFSDIERVEVLRGPQGTLFGKNTTAGAIEVISRGPTFHRQGEAEVSVGENGYLQARASITGALIEDRLAGRLSALTTRRDGVIQNVVSGIDHNEIRNEAWRAQLLFTPSTDLSLRLIADFADFDSDCCTQVYLRVGESLRAPGRQFPALAAGLGYAPPSTNPYDRLTDIDADLRVETEEGGLSVTVGKTAGTFALTSISAWRYWDWNAANDRDYTGIPIQLRQGIPSRQDQYSQEVRLSTTGDGPLNYVVGLYYFNQTIAGRQVSIYGPAATYWLLGPATQFPSNLLDGYGAEGSTRFTTDSYAAFGEANWRLTDQLTLTGGLRYTYEEKSGDYRSVVFGGLATADPRLAAAKLSIFRPQAYTAEDEDGSFSGRANLAWQVTDTVMTYASLARGFKSGGINMSGLPLDARNQPVLATAVIRPEQNTTFEAGVKSELLDRRLLLNLAAYHTTVQDFQATLVDSSQTVALRGYLSNIPEVAVQGLEADAVLRIAPGLVLRGAAAYADGEYADYPAGPCPLERQAAGAAACNLTGQRLSGLSRWSTSLSADWSRPVSLSGRSGEVYVHADSNWRTGYPGEPTLSRYTWIDSFNLTNASVGVRFGDGWDAAIFARNLFDEDYIQNLTIQAGNSGLILGTPSDPRLVGVTLRRRL
jgi:iron complex outermembrane receptor protein